MLQIETIDISRNDRGQILVSLDVPAASGIDAENAVALIFPEGDRWRVQIRDLVTPELSLMLPPVSAEVGQWILSTPCFTAADQVEDDSRVVGQRYILVGEVVGRAVEHGYPAKIMQINRPRRR